eukprot:1866858-Amphidinium_carterae.2
MFTVVHATFVEPHPNVCRHVLAQVQFPLTAKFSLFSMRNQDLPQRELFQLTNSARPPRLATCRGVPYHTAAADAAAEHERCNWVP